jgi:microcystin-dependent protein
MLKVFLQLPRKFCDLVTYLFNEDGTLSDAFIREVAVLPVGIVVWQPTTVIPNGWLLCDGREIERAAYQQLLAVIGTTFGNGNGSTTFNLPDLRGMFLMGKNSTRAIGDTGGEETHVLTIPEMPAHTHLFYPLVSVDANNGGANGRAYGPTQTIDTSVTGGDAAHNNLPPYVIGAFIIKM